MKRLNLEKSGYETTIASQWQDIRCFAQPPRWRRSEQLESQCSVIMVTSESAGRNIAVTSDKWNALRPA
jgi:hypothetical protein